MATLERFNPNDYLLTDGKNERYTFWFIPDCPSFGFWTSKPDAEMARGIWLDNYRTARQSDWKRYCEGRGFKQVFFR
jgi:hypothetical protein